MYQPLHCISLRSVPYNDRYSVLSVYSLELGRVSLLVSAANTASGRRARASTMPMAEFECMADVKPSRTIYNMRGLQPSADNVYAGAGIGPVKGSVAMFVADFLSQALREAEADPRLYSYLRVALATLRVASQRQTANWHLALLVQFARFAGVEPDWGSYRQGSVFDMQEGVFRQSLPLHGKALVGERAAAAYRIGRMTLGNAGRFRFSHEERSEMLDVMLDYYRIHVPSVKRLNSVDVVRSLFE